MFGNSFIPRLIIFGFLAFIPALALLWTPETASGQDSILPPHLYTGSVMLDSLPVADGVIVRALIGDLERGRDSVEGGRYVILVSAGGAPEVRFMVGDAPATETGAWARGRGHLAGLDLPLA